MKRPALNEVGLLRLAKPDRAVGLAHREVEFLVGEDELHADLGIEFGEFVQALGQPAGAKPHRGRDPQHARGPILGLVQPCLDRFELHQHVVRRAEQHLALLGQHKAAGVTIEQRHADVVFERAHLAGDRRLGQAQRLGGMGERPRLRRGVKHA